jgi:inositol-pentakisphosphate 2-kinase
MQDEDSSFLAKAFAPQDGDTILYFTLMTENRFEKDEEDLTIPYINHNAEKISTTIKVRFLAEGAANVLFTILPVEQDTRPLSPAHLIASNHLLRLRKMNPKRELATSVNTAPTPTYVSAAKLCYFIDTEIAPIISSQFLITHLRVGYSENFLDKCNSVLRSMERKRMRNPKRQGAYFDDGVTRIGLIVENMRPNPTEDAILFEFKFKWLRQSPGAPLNARRCRTCAWQIKTGIDQANRYCPLALASGNEKLVMNQLRRLFKISNIELPTSWSIEKTIGAVTAYFLEPSGGYELLNILSLSQQELDPSGILKWVSLPRSISTRSDSPEFESIVEHSISEYLPHLLKLARAMTLRDCTAFVRVSRNASNELSLSAKLGDLDPKVVEKEKVLKWAKDELSLNIDGYYDGTDLINTTKHPESENMEVCMLW